MPRPGAAPYPARVVHGTPARLDLKVRLPQDAVVVSATGELDADTATTLVSYTINQIRGYTAAITLDLAGLSHCDSVGLTALAHIRDTCQSRGLRFLVVRPQPLVAQALEAAGVGPIQV